MHLHNKFMQANVVCFVYCNCDTFLRCNMCLVCGKTTFVKDICVRHCGEDSSICNKVDVVKKILMINFCV